jgi:DNA modification methylase
MKEINDLDLKNWRELQNDITTDSLWISSTSTKNRSMFLIPKRDILPKNDSEFHGLFIPEIPYQMIKRFTKEGETVWDCFGGSGTTKKVADILKRKCVINDLNPKQPYIEQGNSFIWHPSEKVQLIIVHPPYFNIVKYSENDNDLSKARNLFTFYDSFSKTISNISKWLDDNRFLILIVGNIYLEGEEIDLGVICKDIVREKGFKCKSHIIKDYGETKGSEGKNYNLNYYRQLRGNYNNFYGDNIFILQKI